MRETLKTALLRLPACDPRRITPLELAFAPLVGVSAVLRQFFNGGNLRNESASPQQTVALFPDRGRGFPYEEGGINPLGWRRLFVKQVNRGVNSRRTPFKSNRVNSLLL